jgi:transposase InsO family protein
MDLARYVVEAVVRQGRSYRDVARAHGVSKSWVAKLVVRYRQGGEQALAPRSRAPHRIPHRTAPEVEDEIIALRKSLADRGLDAGAQTIWVHLARRRGNVPSVSTIWRVLRRRGFVTPQPHKRPRSSWTRFEATLPNECWQSDVTHWRLEGGREVDICNFIDDHSRLAVASRVFPVTTAHDAVATFLAAGATWGFPAALLTDNGCVYTTWHRGGPNAMQTELLARGIEFRHSRPYHPQTCGKVERFHQTLKAYLAKQDPASSVAELQVHVDRFVAYYNDERPHRARGRMTPREAYEARDRARPSGVPIDARSGVRVRRDRVDRNGKLTLRHRGKLHHIGVGRVHRNTPVVMLVRGLEVRIVGLDGELIREFMLDPSRDYQPLG